MFADVAAVVDSDVGLGVRKWTRRCAAAGMWLLWTEFVALVGCGFGCTVMLGLQMFVPNRICLDLRSFGGAGGLLDRFSPFCTMMLWYVGVCRLHGGCSNGARAPIWLQE
jgi:hypothetical protein